MNAPATLSALRKPLPAGFTEQLQHAFGARLSLAAAVREHHGRDESAYAPMPPDAVVFAESTEDVATLVALCIEHRVPVIPYGVGSSLEGHLLAVQGGVSVDMSRMNKVLAVNPEDLTVTVQAGVTRKLSLRVRDPSPRPVVPSSPVRVAIWLSRLPIAVRFAAYNGRILDQVWSARL